MLTRRELNQLAVLARLSLSGEEEASLLRDLEEILKYVSELKAVEAAGPPAGPTGAPVLVWRPDEPVGGEAADAARPEELLAAAPELRAGLVVMPPVWARDSK